ncbi:E3 ubiquitin-protein ligase RNF168-like [Plodia interpunctella]|uniref:E3 ubiquitin-protein ligase RNF168-like n=1 Tax=Plodia interpunctella TaxID=58824 RepID=UPI0023687820|nr:E3 ubiquitin-protein ligase RNF168-like [Plodia interpunctella]
MAAKSKKRLSKIENKLLKLDKLELKDVFCSICHSILVEPVTLPCYHDFCLRCFNGSVENNALCCPLCRLRIGSWLRNATKQKNLVNVDLWDFIKLKFSKEIDIKTKGEDINLPEDKPVPRLSAPGEIRLEYENELRRLRTERLQLEEKHLQETELLIKKIQQEEEEAHKKYLEAVKKDELLAQEMQHEQAKSKTTPTPVSKAAPKKRNLRGTETKPRLKATRIDGYLSKVKATIVKDNPLLTDDNTSTDNSTPKESSLQYNNRGSPELIPRYGKVMKNIIDKKIKSSPGIWNKENGDNVKEKKTEPEISSNSKEDEQSDDKKAKSKNTVQSLLVSLPLPNSGVFQHKTFGNRSVETGSVDSMRQELCYFKPIEASTPTSFSLGKGFPLKIPSVRAEKESTAGLASPPSQEQYMEGLCRLRHLSITNNLPSAFVVVLNALKCTKNHIKVETRQRIKKSGVINSNTAPILPVKRNASNRSKMSGLQVDGISKLKPVKNLRRTRSMGSMSKDENETTPKKAKLKERKVASERRPYLRSDSKKFNAKKQFDSPSPIPESINNNKINLVVKNLSSPLKNCDLKNIVHEQLRIEKIIEQEKNDFELARKVDAEWNGRRQLRRPPVKRQVPLSYALRPAKKLKV